MNHERLEPQAAIDLAGDMTRESYHKLNEAEKLYKEIAAESLDVSWIYVQVRKDLSICNLPYT